MAEAVELGIAAMRLDGLDRRLNGDLVPVYRRGKLARVEHRRSDRLPIAVVRRTALSRREHRLDLAALDAAHEQCKTAKAAADLSLRTEIDRLANAIHERCQHGPRVTRL